MKILLQNVTLPLGSGAGSLSYLPMSSNKHLWPLSNRLFCQNCFTLLSYRFIFTAFTIILCSPKTTWRPFPLVLYLPSGTSKIFRLIGCALCSSFLHAKDLPTTNAAALLTYLIRNYLAEVFKTALHVGQNKEKKFPWGHPYVSTPIEHGQQPITALLYPPHGLTRNTNTHKESAAPANGKYI